MSHETKIVIDKNVPIARSGAGRYTKYPFRLMEVGDSFFVPGVEDSRHLSSLVSYWQKKLGHRYTVRIKDENGRRITKDGKPGARVQRIAKEGEGYV